jgi:hypothetical protein
MHRGYSESGDVMGDHYRGFSHPVLVDIPIEPTMSLFDEMDQIADELRANPDHIETMIRLRSASFNAFAIPVSTAGRNGSTCLGFGVTVIDRGHWARDRRRDHAAEAAPMGTWG